MGAKTPICPPPTPTYHTLAPHHTHLPPQPALLLPSSPRLPALLPHLQEGRRGGHCAPCLRANCARGAVVVLLAGEQHTLCVRYTNRHSAAPCHYLASPPTCQHITHLPTPHRHPTYHAHPHTARVYLLHCCVTHTCAAASWDTSAPFKTLLADGT